MWYFYINVLLLSYINKIEAVTLKHIKNKVNQSSVSTKQTNKKKKTKKNQLHKVLIHMIPLLILGVLIFIIKKTGSISLTEKK